MIGYLRGIPRKTSAEKVLLDVGGVGYEVHLSTSTLQHVAAAGAGTVELFVHTHLREDSLSLYGFLSELELELFELLLGVNGVGPRLARTILSGPGLDQLISALSAADLKRLAQIPGVGKKTAERLVLELRDKVQPLAARLPVVPAGPRTVQEDVASALVNLGYKRPEADRAVEASRKESPDAAFHELLRSSLKQLSRL